MRLTFALDVSGGFGGNGSTVGGGVLSAASWSGRAFWRASANVSSYGFVRGNTLSRNSAGDIHLSDTGVFDTSVYTIDVPLGLTSVQLRAEAGASSNVGVFMHSADPMLVSAEAAFSSDLGSTVAWGGILGLSTLDGVAIDDFTAFSESSGFNYRQAFAPAVPEPRIWATMALGLVLMGWVRRRRKLAVAQEQEGVRSCIHASMRACVPN